MRRLAAEVMGSVNRVVVNRRVASLDMLTRPGGERVVRLHFPTMTQVDGPGYHCRKLVRSASENCAVRVAQSALSELMHTKCG